MTVEFLFGLAANHLWQSTLFAAIAGVLTIAFRRNNARVRFGLWLAASLKFLIPMSLLVALGIQWGGRTAKPLAQPIFSTVMQEISQPFLAPASHSAHFAAVPATNAMGAWQILALIFWVSGFAAVLIGWTVRWREIRAMLRQTRRPESGPELAALLHVQQVSGVHQSIELRVSDTRMEPGIFGIFRPVLLLPAGIGERLGDAKLEAIIAHELCHVRRRDNLFSFLHLIVQAVFWFHPLTWWLGTRLMEERERACDEEVLRLGNNAQVYAEGILQICRHYLQSPPCAAGVTGSRLQTRIREIMTGRLSDRLNPAKKLLLASFAALAIVLPLAIGVAIAPPGRAQSPQQPATPVEFDVASIKPAAPRDGSDFQMLPGGRMVASNVTVMGMLRRAYRLKDFQITGGPGWMNSQGWDIVAKTDAAVSDPNQLRALMAKLLEQRFHLVFHRETKEVTTYALLTAKNGPKMQEAKSGDPSRMHSSRSLIEGQNITMGMLAEELSNAVGRVVVDETGLKASYEFRVQWTPEMAGRDGAAADSASPTLFTALQEQLGLRLESRKAPIEIIVVDRLEKVSEN